MSLQYESLWDLPRPALTRRRLTALLRRHGFSPAAFEIAEHLRSGFNRLFTLEAPDGRAWLAKQNSRPPEAETWFYSELAEAFDATPACLLADSQADVVVLEYLRGAVALDQLALEDPAGVFDRLEDLAPTVARLHSMGRACEGAPRAQISFPELGPIDVRFWASSPPAARELLTQVQERPGLVQAFRTASEGPGQQGLIHGDLKLDNLLRIENRALLVDWGCCGIGAVGWDLGALVGSMVMLWADRWSADVGRATAGADDSARLEIDEVFAAAGRFLAAYRGEAQAVGLAAPDTETLAAFVAAWITGRSWVEAMHARYLGGNLRIRLAVAEAIAGGATPLSGGSS